jgi:hypothetical protein
MTLENLFKEQKQLIEDTISKIDTEEKILQVISNVAMKKDMYTIICYLSIYVHIYGYEKTLEFIKSRSMWEGKDNDKNKARKQILVNLSLYLQNYEEKFSVLTLKPLFSMV